MWTLALPNKHSINTELPNVHFINQFFPINAAAPTFNAGIYFKDLFYSHICIWHNFTDIEFDLIEPTDWVIFSAGDVYHPAVVDLFNKCITRTGGRVISWGCGYNLQEGNDKLLDKSLNKRGFALFTTRDYNFISEFGKPERYLPCPSCMQPGLDIEREITREVGVIEHKLFPINDFPQYEKLNNSIQALQLLDFIASSRVIVTNSYHITYWAGLLRRKVILFSKHASKYDYFKHPPTMYSGNLEADIECAVIYPDALEECRRLNMEFANEVISVIKTDDGLERDLSGGEIMNPDIVFFGAGDHAKNNYERWVSEGLNAVCFSDMDEQRHYYSLGGLKILPVGEIVRRYPNYVFYVTYCYEYLQTATDYLIEYEISRERIKYADPYEWRKGCIAMGKHISYSYDSYYICCPRDYRLAFKRSESIESDIREAQNYLTDLIDDLRNGRPTDCDNCFTLRYGIWEKHPKLWRISVTSDFAQVFCNFNCMYCLDEKNLKKHRDGNRKTEETPFDFIKKAYSAAETYGLILGYAAGEITVCPWGEEALDFLIEKRWYTQHATNAFVYSEKIAKMLHDRIADVVVSVDAGTRETFYKVRNIDGWNKIIENLEKYADVRGHLTLKYLLVEGINDNETDVDGFIKLCKRLNLPALLAVTLINQKSLNSNMLDTCFLFAKIAKKNNVPAGVLGDHFFKDDLKLVERAFQEQEQSKSHLQASLDIAHQRITDLHEHIYPHVEASNRIVNDRIDELKHQTDELKHQTDGLKHQIDELWDVTFFTRIKRPFRKILNKLRRV